MSNHDEQIEIMIKKVGADVAPRVTKEHIDAMMKRVEYVTVQQPNGTNSTFVYAYLDGKFMLATGESHCVSSENFKPEVGITVATEKAAEFARNKLWELEGYKLYVELNSIEYTNAMMIANARQSMIQNHESFEDHSTFLPHSYRIELKDGAVVIANGWTREESYEKAFIIFNEYFDKNVKPTLPLLKPL